MIVCTPNRQKAFLNNIKRQKIINVQTIIDFAKSYLELDDNVTKLSEVLDSFSTERREFINYLQNIAGISVVEAGEGESEIKIKGPKNPLSSTNISPNFIAANVDSLFTGMHIAHLRFKQKTNEQLIFAAYLGKEHENKYASDNEITDNMNLLKNNLFKEIVDYLITQGLLIREDYFKVETIAGREIETFVTKLFDDEGFNYSIYKAHYKKVMKLLENHLLKDINETIVVPNSNQRIPELLGKFEDPIANKKYDAYNAAILLLNFDAVILKDFKNILGVDKTTFNVFESPINGPKYFRKVKGLETLYFKEDGVTTGGVEEIESKLSHSLISIIPIYSANGNLNGQFMEMKDLYGLGAMLNDFQLENFTHLAKLKNWVPLEEDPIRMLNWYIDAIIKAFKDDFVDTGTNEESLSSDLLEIFKHKVNIAISLKEFLKVIKNKEANATSFSMARIITQPLVNSVGAVYSTDIVGKHIRRYKEMHSHNSEKVQLQESIYAHLKNKLSNWDKLYKSKESLTKSLQELHPNSIRKIIGDLTGIYLDNDAIYNLLEKWIPSEQAIGRSLTKDEMIASVVGELSNIISKIFKTKEIDVEVPATKNKEAHIIKQIIPIFKESLFQDITENEENIEKLSYDQIKTTNNIINPLSSTGVIQQILDEKLKSVKSVILTKVSKQGGEPIPTTVIPSVGFNDITLLRERKILEQTNSNRLYKNHFVNNGGLKGTIIRLETLEGENDKDASLLNIVENFTSHFEYDFLESLKVLPEGSFAINDVNIMIGNYADKSRILDKRISNKASLNDKAIIRSTSPIFPSKVSKDVMKSDEIWEASRKQSLNYYTDLTLDLIDKYTKLIPGLIPKTIESTIKYFQKIKNGKVLIDYDKILKHLDKINSVISKIPYEDFLRAINSLEGDFIKELHYSIYKEKGVQKIALNNTIIDYIKIYSDKNLFNAFVERQRESFLYKMLDFKPGGVLLNAKTIANLASSEDGYDENVMKLILHSIGYDYATYKKSFIIPGTSQKIVEEEEEEEDVNAEAVEVNANPMPGDHRMYIVENNKIILNPLVDKWLSVNEFFRNEYLYISVKPEYMHPAKELRNKSKNQSIESFLNDFSNESALRLIGMGKRNVSMTGSTELPSRKSKLGAPDNVNVVVIDDYVVEVPLISGENVKRQNAHDGSSILPYTYSKMIDMSYQGKDMEGAKKQLGTLITEFGSALKKDAESVISNSNIRNSNNSKVRFRDKQKQVYSIPIFIDNFDSGIIRSNNKFFRNGDYYAINDYKVKNNLVTYTMSKYNNVSKIWVRMEPQEPILINNLFNFWELFGAEDSVDNDFEFSEGSNEMLYDLIVSYKPDKIDKDDINDGYILKSKMIHIISNHTSFKSGASNLHTADYWTNSEKLKYTTYRNRHMGIQLVATHDIINSKTKEVTQLVSALAQNPDTAELADEMYQTLADVIEESIKKTYKDVATSEEKHLKDTYRILSNSLIKSLANSSNKGLAQTIAETFDHGQLLPFSNQNFFRDFIKDLVVRMNKDFITRYYPGTGAILTPSHGIITVYENSNGDVFSQSDLRDLAIKYYNNNRSLYAENLTTQNIIDIYIDLMFKDEDVNAGSIQLLESVNIDGEILTLDTIKKYYDFKHKYEDTIVKRSRKTSRDLKPIEISFSTAKNIINEEGLTEQITVTETLWDLTPMKLKFIKDYSTPELSKLLTQFKKYFNIDDSTLEGKKLLELKLNIWLHRENQILSKNRKLKNILNEEFTKNGVTDFKNYFKDDNLSSIVIEDYINNYINNSSELLSYKKKAAELILGNIYSDVFNTNKDTVAFIRDKGYRYFKDKFKKYYKYNDSIKADFKISTDNRDVYVKFVSKYDLPQIAGSKTKGFILDDFHPNGSTKKVRINDSGETLYELPKNSVIDIFGDYDILYIEAGEKISSFIEKIGEDKKVKRISIKKFNKYKNIEDIVDILLKSFESNIKAIVPVMNNKIKDDSKFEHDFNKEVYDLFKLYSGYIPSNFEPFNNYLKNHLDNILEQISKRTYVSWDKSTEFVASRIPAQSMQSFMEMKNVSYFNTNNNEAYVSIWQIVIQGSDFDIDKAYLMGYGFNKMGHYESSNDAFKFTSKESLDEIETLPKPSKIETTFVINQSDKTLDISKEFLEFVKSVEYEAPTGSISLLQWLREIYQITSIENREGIESGLNLSPETIKIIGKILKSINNHKEVNINYIYNPLIDEDSQTKMFDNYKRILSILINRYNTSKNYTKNKFSQINANVASIKRIISNPSNQLWANKPVDITPLHDGAAQVVMEREQKINKAISKILEGKKDANLDSIEKITDILSTINSLYDVQVIKEVKTLGEYVQEAQRINKIKNTLSAHDMVSMFKQQSDAIIGKKDVGIGASGIKVMFALNDYYNKYYKSLSISSDNKIYNGSESVDIMQDPKWFRKTLDMGENIGTVVKATIADVWLDNKLHKTIASNLGLEGQENLLKIVQNGMAAIYISGFISGATDNAKELIMAKINAINELASMHLYLMTLGFTAEQVAGYMTSDLANYIVKKINSSNIYKSAKEMRVKNIIENYIVNNPSNENLANTFLDIYEGAAEMLNLAAMLKINQSTSADISSMFLFLNKFNKAMYTRENAVLGDNLWQLSSEKEFDKAVKLIIEKSSNNLTEAYVENVLINSSNIEVSYINEKGELVKKRTSLLAGGFDFRYYIQPENSDYRKRSIEYYNLFKNTINIFDVVENSSHFKAMINGLSNVHINAMTVSKKYNFVFNTALDIIREKSHEIYNNNAKTIKNYLGNSSLVIDVDEYMISKMLRGYDGFVVSAWAKTEDLSNYQISVQKLLKQVGEENFEVYVGNDAKIDPIGKSTGGVKIIKANTGEDYIINLTTDFGIATYKKMMEEIIFPILRKSKSSNLGSLLRTRTLRNPYGLLTSQITATFGISSLDSSTNVTKYQDLLYNFNQVDFKIEQEYKIKGKNDVILKYKDLFYLYNLIVNNEQYGDNRLTAIFQDYVKDKNNIAYKYLNFSKNIDLREVDIFKIDIDPSLTDGSVNAIYDRLMQSFKNDVIHMALNKRGAVNVKRLDGAISQEIAIRNSHFVINTHADISDNLDVEKYTQYQSLLSILKNSNLLINFKCD